MTWDWLRLAEAPWIRLATSSTGSVYDALKHEAHRRGLALRILRGSRMRTEDALMDEFAAACQLPPYFGANWDALDECLQDLEIAAGEGVVLAVMDAEQLLADAPPEHGRILFDLLQDIAAAHAGQSRPLPFHVVLQAESNKMPALEAGLRALGVSAARI
ncbi:MAG TPA: barstar family protein [Holophagaceae bacterium]|nr:barstar family protein [Holophagaceae bacterium]